MYEKLQNIYQLLEDLEIIEINQKVYLFLHSTNLHSIQINSFRICSYYQGKGALLFASAYRLGNQEICSRSWRWYISAVVFVSGLCGAARIFDSSWWKIHLTQRCLMSIAASYVSKDYVPGIVFFASTAHTHTRARSHTPILHWNIRPKVRGESLNRYNFYKSRHNHLWPGQI